MHLIVWVLYLPSDGINFFIYKKKRAWSVCVSVCNMFFCCHLRCMYCVCQCDVPKFFCLFFVKSIHTQKCMMHITIHRSNCPAVCFRFQGQIAGISRQDSKGQAGFVPEVIIFRQPWLSGTSFVSCCGKTSLSAAGSQ